MYDDIKNYVRNCEICLQEGGLLQNTCNTPIITNRPNEMWQIDLVGPMKCEDGSKKYVLITIDHFTKWTEASILSNAQASVVVNEIREKNT